jgi:ribosomal protein S18 acetylase RimI-like enzyme
MPTITELPADEESVRRYTRELWLPYHRELESTIEQHALVDDVPLETEVEFRLDKLQQDGYRAWIALEGTAVEEGSVEGDGGLSLAETDQAFVGFVTAEVEHAPVVFDQQDRVRLGDIYVSESHRGTGLADDFFERVQAYARERECTEVTLDVDVDNDRALSFYETLGFEPYRQELVRQVERE